MGQKRVEICHDVTLTDFHSFLKNMPLYLINRGIFRQKVGVLTKKRIYYVTFLYRSP